MQRGIGPRPAGINKYSFLLDNAKQIVRDVASGRRTEYSTAYSKEALYRVASLIDDISVGRMLESSYGHDTSMLKPAVWSVSNDVRKTFLWFREVYDNYFDRQFVYSGKKAPISRSLYESYIDAFDDIFYKSMAMHKSVIMNAIDALDESERDERRLVMKGVSEDINSTIKLLSYLGKLNESKLFYKANS